ncbi:MAG TPA: protein-glutamate O-methyltransferase CheR [Nitrospirota bacterium]|nr:protein-glutamate O-methyltransferase CheR [Nitrospirota bacterium]
MLNQVLPDVVFKQLRDFIHEKCGIYIPDSKKYLIEKKLTTRLHQKNLSTYEDYLSLLKYSSNGDELSKLYDAITTNETYFFREPQQLAVFVDTVIPQVMEQKKSRDIKIWSAACSTGEEAYTLAIMLLEKKCCTRIDIVGSDISSEVLESAKKAVYGSYSMRNVAEPFLKKYFHTNGWTHELDASVKGLVRFMNINLIDPGNMRTLQAMDVIFCRNVLIYFDDNAKQKAVSLLYDRLRPGGFLFIGASESLHSVTRAFKPVIFNKIIAYQRV